MVFDVAVEGGKNRHAADNYTDELLASTIGWCEYFLRMDDGRYLSKR